MVSAIGDLPASGISRMFSALSSSSCAATSFASMAGSMLVVFLRVEAGLESALLPDLELRRADRALSFGLLEWTSTVTRGVFAGERKGLEACPTPESVGAHRHSPWSPQTRNLP